MELKLIGSMEWFHIHSVQISSMRLMLFYEQIASSQKQ